MVWHPAKSRAVSRTRSVRCSAVLIGPSCRQNSRCRPRLRGWQGIGRRLGLGLLLAFDFPSKPNPELRPVRFVFQQPSVAGSQDHVAVDGMTAPCWPARLALHLQKPSVLEFHFPCISLTLFDARDLIFFETDSPSLINGISGCSPRIAAYSSSILSDPRIFPAVSLSVFTCGCLLGSAFSIAYASRRSSRSSLTFVGLFMSFFQKSN